MKPWLTALAVLLFTPLALAAQEGTSTPAQDEPAPEKQDPAPAEQDPAPAEEEPAPLEEEPVPAEEGDGMVFTAGGGYSLWIAPFDFEASGPTIRFERDSAPLGGFGIFGRLDLDETWSIQADADFAFGTKLGVTVLGLGGVYRFGLLEAPWNTHLRASILYGILEDGDAPGDFDPGIGFEAGGGVDYSLADLVLDGLHARADVMGRFLEFEFDADPGITSDDGEIGGFGIRLLLGLEYRF